MSRAEQACRQSISEAARLRNPKPLDPTRLVAISERAKRLAHTTAQRLKQATPTRETTVEYGKFVVHVEDVGKQLEDLREAARERNRHEVEQSLLTIHHRAEEGRSVARRLGLTTCAQLADLVARKADPAPASRPMTGFSPGARGVAALTTTSG